MSLRAGMRAILAPSFDIVGEADNVDSAIELIKERLPDLVVLDVKLPGGGGAAVIPAVRRDFPDIRFMALTVSTSKEDVRSGSSTPVSTATSPRPHSGQISPTWFARRTSELGRFHLTWPPISLDIDEDITGETPISRLTPREREVVNLMARGYTYRESAERLGITVKTLENHMAHIFDKLSVASRHELTALAYEEGYVRPDDER